MILQSIQMVQGRYTSSLFSFFWHNIRKISIGKWLPFINLQMNTAHVYQTECFQNSLNTKSENEIHAYWYNIDTNNQSQMLRFWCKTLEKLSWELKFLLCAVRLLLTYLGCHLMIKLCLFSLLESFSSLCCFSAMQAPNGLRSIKLTAFSKAVQYLDM